MDIGQYRSDFIEQLRVDASAEGVTPEEKFIEKSLSNLEGMGVLNDPFTEYFGQRGPNGSLMKIDGYAIDSSDRSLTLFQSAFSNSDDPAAMTRTELEQRYGQMMAFLKACIDGRLAKYCDESNNYVKVAMDLKNRFEIKYVNDGEDLSIEKIKLLVFTNSQLSTKLKSLPDETFLDRKVERNVWSLERFFEIESMGLEREPVIIHLADFGVEGLPCLRAELNTDGEYDAYLSIVPGKVLSDIYYKYGSRLLEGNVRAFLSNKGKINQGIRKTILTDPKKFFTYNNGIACTAESIEVARGSNSLLITDLRDLQIINGGQTTASLTSAFVKDKSDLGMIYVPMKLTVIKNKDVYEDTVQKISRFANSQNKVTDADFFSNHPFHVAFEQLAKAVVAPAKQGALAQTYWYYERSRGKYNQEMFKMTEAQRKSFQIKFPRQQVIRKEELAKYYNTINLKPFFVTRGGAKNMGEFGKTIDLTWQNKKQELNNQEFFKKCVCAAILFRACDKVVAGSDWYKTGGFKSQVVPYAIAKLIASIPNDKSLDYDRIWKLQDLYPSLYRELERITKVTNEWLESKSSESHALLSELAKKEETWKAFKDVPFSLSKEFSDDLSDLSFEVEKNETAAKEQKKLGEINIEAEIVRLGGDYWNRLLKEGLERKILGPMDVKLLQIGASLSTSRPMIPSPKQAKDMWRIRDRLEKNGVLV